MAEAYAIGRRIGRRTIIIATSTGGTLAAAAALDAVAMRNVAGIVFVAPNFGLQNKATDVTDAPAISLGIGCRCLSVRCARSPPRRSIARSLLDNELSNGCLCCPWLPLLTRSWQQTLRPPQCRLCSISAPMTKLCGPRKPSGVAGRWGGPASDEHVPVLGPNDDPLGAYHRR